MTCDTQNSNLKSSGQLDRVLGADQEIGKDFQVFLEWDTRF